MLDEWHVYGGAELQAGINLADEFQRTPFSDVFRCIDSLVLQEQSVESSITWRGKEPGAGPGGAGLAADEAHRAHLLDEVRRPRVRVAHNIRIVPLP